MCASVPHDETSARPRFGILDDHPCATMPFYSLMNRSPGILCISLLAGVAQNERLALGRYLLRVEAAARGSTNGSKPAAAETVITITPPR